VLKGRGNKMVVSTEFINSTIPYVAVYKSVPFYLNPFFAVAILLFFAILIIGAYAYFRISMRNRTNVIIHMPDKTRRFFSYKNFTGNEFKIKSEEPVKDGQERQYFSYFFKPEYVEFGYFGRYIEYDYGISMPIGHNERMKGKESSQALFKTISGILDSQLLVDLLLSQKFKNFVQTMLIIILIGVGISLLTSIGQYFFKPVQECVLSYNNQTINVIRLATMR
jgi:amino acid transporter